MTTGDREREKDKDKVKESPKREELIGPLRYLISGCARGAELTMMAPLNLPNKWARILRMSSAPKIQIVEFLQVKSIQLAPEQSHEISQSYVLRAKVILIRFEASAKKFLNEKCSRKGVENIDCIIFLQKGVHCTSCSLKRT